MSLRLGESGGRTSLSWAWVSHEGWEGTRKMRKAIDDSEGMDERY